MERAPRSFFVLTPVVHGARSDVSWRGGGDRMRRAFGVLVVVLVAVSCGGDDTAGALLSETPPWGLTSIDMPDTEEDVIAAMAALPDEIDGRRRLRGALTGVSYGESRILWIVTALPGDDPVMMTGANPDPTAAEYVIDRASHGSLGTIEASAFDASGDLVWAASNLIWEELDAPPGQQEGTAYMITWARPDGSWSFHIQADSAAGRTQLVHAFITAAAG
jgi:hypothetical protein